MTTAFEGIGSQRAGGRWNTPGRAVVYASEHPATATLEILVHVKRAQLLRDHYSLITAEVSDSLVRSLDLDAMRTVSILIKTEAAKPSFKVRHIIHAQSYREIYYLIY